MPCDGSETSLRRMTVDTARVRFAISTETLLRKSEKRERTWNAEDELVILEERVPVELDHLVGDAAAAELVADGLGHHDDDLRVAVD